MIGETPSYLSDDVLVDVDVIFAYYRILPIKNYSVGVRREEHIKATEI